MPGFAIRIETLDLMEQLADRQADHVQAISDHLASHTTLEDVGGAIMVFLGGMYHSGRDNAVQGFAQAKVVCEAVAERAKDSKESYLAAEEAIIDALERLIGRFDLDIEVPRAQPGSSPTLGPATGSTASATDSGPGPFGRFFGRIFGGADSGVTGFRRTGGAGVNRYIDTVLPRGDLPEGAIDMGPLGESPPSLASRAEDRIWDSLENRRDGAEDGRTGSGQTLRERFNSQQHARWSEGYHSGYDRTGGGTSPRDVDWVSGGYSERTWRAGQDVAGAYGEIKGAVNAYRQAFAAEESYQSVRAVAGGESNTAAHDWATGEG